MSAWSQTRIVRPPTVASLGGIVAARNRLAAEFGAGILAAGGDAVDATSFALGEPWTSGPTGGGATISADATLPAAVGGALSQRRKVVTTPRTVYPHSFACPVGAMRQAGENFGASKIMSPRADAVAERPPPSD